MSGYYGETVAEKSPITIRTRFEGQYVCVQDLQAQLRRDQHRAPDYETKDYISELIKRLDGLKE